MVDNKQLQDAIEQSYNIQGIRDLCLELGIDYENIEGEAKKDKAREMILLLMRDGRLPELIDIVQKKRPDLMTDPAQKEEEEALNYYYDFMLPTWDRIDLMGQAERDARQILAKFTLQECYVPLHVEVDQSDDGQRGDPGDLKRAGRRLHASSKKKRLAIGKLIQKEMRLVILGDPGSGKTTLTKWLALAYLLKQKPHDAYANFPAIDTLPDTPWLPLIIPCRYLDEGNAVTIDQLVRKSLSVDLQRPELIDPLQRAILKKMECGEVMLIIDGLDEISPPNARVSFSKRLITIARSYEAVPIVVTSRQYGYEQMGFRLEEGFLEVSMAELRPSEQKQFIHQWCQVTQLSSQKPSIEERMLATIEADTIKKIARNPLQLTTIALVLQKQPNISPSRIRLYTACIDVLFNWHPERKGSIDQRIAMQHLGYLAYFMCDQETKTLNEDKIITLWEEMQEQYSRRPFPSPEVLLEGLTARTNILVAKQNIARNGRIQPVYAFQHALFQDFLAGQQAITNSLYPGFRERLGLSEHIDKLVSQVEKVTCKINNNRTVEEPVVTEKWQEPLRLFLAGYEPTDIDDLLLAVLEPEEQPESARARAVLAASCLLDEPDIDDETSYTVLRAFMDCVQDYDAWTSNPESRKTSLDDVVWELGQRETWSELLNNIVLDAFINQPGITADRFVYGRIFLLANNTKKIVDTLDTAGFNDLVNALTADSEAEVIKAVLILLDAAFYKRLAFNPTLHNSLMTMMFNGSLPVQTAASWAFRWLISSYYSQKISWQPEPEQAEKLYAFLADPATDKCAIINLLTIITQEMIEAPKWHRWTLIAGKKYELSYQKEPKLPIAEELKNALLFRLIDEEKRVRTLSVLILGQVGFVEETILEPLLELIDDEESKLVDRETAVQLLACVPGEKVQDALLARQNSAQETTRYAAQIALIGRQPTKTEAENKTSIAWRRTHAYQFNNCLACVLVKGTVPSGSEKGYVYVSLHLHEFLKMMLDIEKYNQMNSSDYNATVLARFRGEPSKDVQEFMRRKFGFSETEIIIQRETPVPIVRTVPVPDSPIIVPAKTKTPTGNENENDFPLKDIEYMRIGSGYLHSNANYDTNLAMFKAFCDRFNSIYEESPNNQIVFEEIKD